MAHRTFMRAIAPAPASRRQSPKIKWRNYLLKVAENKKTRQGASQPNHLADEPALCARAKYMMTGRAPQGAAGRGEERCSTAGRVEAGMLAEERETEQVLRTCGGPCSSSASFAQLFGIFAARVPSSAAATPPQHLFGLSLSGQHASSRAALRPASRSQLPQPHCYTKRNARPSNTVTTKLQFPS